MVCFISQHSIQVRVQRVREDLTHPSTKAENGTPSTAPKPVTTTPDTQTPLVNGCNNGSPEGAAGGHLANGTVTINGMSGQEDASPSPPPTAGKGGGKEDSPGKKRSTPTPLLQHLVYDVRVIGEDRVITDVPASHLQ